MNYRHAFHAGNHADVLKHLVLIALLDALKRKDTPFLVLDTHAGRGDYALDSSQAKRTGEAKTGVLKLRKAINKGVTPAPAVQAYLDALERLDPGGEKRTYPGSPRLVAEALREGDHLDACELNPEEAALLKANFARDPRVGAHHRDGYQAMRALLPPKEGRTRGLVLIDPPYEAQEDEFIQLREVILDTLRRWPTGMLAVWYPIKQRRTLMPFFRRMAALPAKSVVVAEVQIQPDDSPLRMTGSGMLVINPPWKLEDALKPALAQLSAALGEDRPSWRLEWLRREEGGETAPLGAPAGRGAPTRAPARAVAPARPAARPGARPDTRPAARAEGARPASAKPAAPRPTSPARTAPPARRPGPTRRSPR
jgi:23S rRNA (adenine2030-N6)-methyltransferase